MNTENKNEAGIKEQTRKEYLKRRRNALPISRVVEDLLDLADEDFPATLEFGEGIYFENVGAPLTDAFASPRQVELKAKLRQVLGDWDGMMELVEYRTLCNVFPFVLGYAGGLRAGGASREVSAAFLKSILRQFDASDFEALGPETEGSNNPGEIQRVIRD